MVPLRPIISAFCIVANSSALIWWTRSSIGYLRCFGRPNTGLGSLLRVALFSFAIRENLLESGRRNGLHIRGGADRVTALSALAAVFFLGALCHILKSFAGLAHLHR